MLILWALTSSPTSATTLCHVVFLPPTSLGLTPGSCSHVADIGQELAPVPCLVSHINPLTCSASACEPGARPQCS